MISDDGDKWSVQLDVRDLGGNWDTMFRAWGASLAAWVAAVLRVVWMVSGFTLETTSRSAWYCGHVLSSLGLLGLFRHAYFEYHGTPTSLHSKSSADGNQYPPHVAQCAWLESTNSNPHARTTRNASWSNSPCRSQDGRTLRATGH